MLEQLVMVMVLLMGLYVFTTSVWNLAVALGGASKEEYRKAKTTKDEMLVQSVGYALAGGGIICLAAGAPAWTVLTVVGPAAIAPSLYYLMVVAPRSKRPRK